MTDTILNAEPVTARRTVEVYALLTRYGPDYWAVVSTYRTQFDAEAGSRSLITENKPWRIVRVTGLPIDVKEGEQKP